MAVLYTVRFVRPSAGDFAAEALNKACSEHGGQRLAAVHPVISEGTTVGWMLFFERPG